MEQNCGKQNKQLEIFNPNNWNQHNHDCSSIILCGLVYPMQCMGSLILI